MKPRVILQNVANTLCSMVVQNSYSLDEIRKARCMVVFMVPPGPIITGGVMSIYSMCQCSRELLPDAACLLATGPGFFTHAANEKFRNSEKVYRWRQVVANAGHLERLTLHIPEIFSARFEGSLNRKDREFLAGLPYLQINILNQNIELMPDRQALQGLYRLTRNVTQTTAHHRCATQETCDRWGMPTHGFTAYIDMSQYAPVPFHRKSKTIVLSPDANPYRESIVKTLGEGLPDYRQVVVKSLTFVDYMDLVASSRFAVTFGEGFDGYFCNPLIVGSVAFSVYNKDYFSDASWLELKNVYASYEDMLENLVADIRRLEDSPQEYGELASRGLGKIQTLYRYEDFKDNLRRFYARQYDFFPRQDESGPG